MAAYTINVGDVIECISWGVLASQTVLMTAHYTPVSGSDADGPAYLAALNDTVTTGSYIFNAFRQLQMADFTYTQVTSQLIYNTRWAPEAKTWSVQGAIDGTSAPQNVAWSFIRHVAEAGRGYQGRVQLCGFNRDWIASGIVTPDVGHIAATVTAANSLTTQITPAGKTMVLKPILFGRRETAISKRDVIKGVATRTVRTMHRRTVGLGI